MRGSLKSLIAFMREVLIDLGTWCGISTSCDWKTVTTRVKHEGLSFFTITLANLGKDFEKSLDQGFVAHDQFPGFSRFGCLPRFLGGFFELVFDRKTGRLLDNPSLDSIKAIRQFSLMMAKIDLPCAERRVQKALNGYVKCEQDVRTSDANLSPLMVEDFKRIGRLLWANALSNIDQKIYFDGVHPKHGPGSTADSLRGNSKYNQFEWTQRLEQVFPSWNYLVPSYNFNSKLDDVVILEPGMERPVKVITVPKTQKTPRIIAMEPTCMQYVQQGILELMKQEFREDDNSLNFVNFDSQEPNKALARLGSVSGSLATLDLSEASDRVSYQHVLFLLANHPHLRDAVDACRSRKADVLGKTLRLAKFASMGSALCFPFEAMVFTTIIFLGIERRLNRQLTKQDIKSYFGRVRVYGDDIIVPVEEVPFVISLLQDFGLKVNTGKSFWTGKFRESCGGDYYNGSDVTIARVNSIFPTSRKSVGEVLATVSLRNHLWLRSLNRSIEFLDRLLEGIIPFPEIESLDSPLLGKLTYGPVMGQRVHPHLQVPLIKGMKVRSVLPNSNLEDSGALMKFFLKRSTDPYEEGHLRFSGRAETVYIKLGWATPF